jgi:hypothetical protein
LRHHQAILTIAGAAAGLVELAGNKVVACQTKYHLIAPAHDVTNMRTARPTIAYQTRENARMKATPRRHPIKFSLSRGAALFAVLIVLAQCSAVPPADPAQPPPPLGYGKLVGDALKKFKDFSSYSNFQISDLRWVHAETGWNWLICVRYDERGLERFYSFFIDGNTIANARYDARTDRCAAQRYVPFDVTTGTVGSATPSLQQPIY